MTTLHRWRRPAAPEARLYCVGHAGVGAAAARALADAAPEWLDVAAVRLPGRERRFSEAAATDVNLLAEALAEAVGRDGAAVPLPTVLVGQCSGAVIAFEVAVRLARRPAVPPCGLVVCSRGAPDSDAQAPDVSADDAAFLAQIIALGGVDAEIVNGAPEVLELVLPVIRADYTMLRGYRVTRRDPVALPILAVRGRLDDGVPLAALEGWRAWTSAGFATRELAGGHFVFSESATALMAEITDFTRAVVDRGIGRVLPC